MTVITKWSYCRVLLFSQVKDFNRPPGKPGYHFYLTCVCTSSPVTIFPTALRAADTTWVRSCLNEIKSNCYQIQYIVQLVPPSFNLKGSLIICACSGNSCQNRSSCSHSAEFLKQLCFSLHMCSSWDLPFKNKVTWTLTLTIPLIFYKLQNLLQLGSFH